MIKAINFVNVPTLMKEMDNWCVFYNDTNGKLDKKPISPITKRGGIKSKDSLGSFEKVSSMIIEGKAAGIGFVLTPDSRIICIDIDCHNLSLQDKYEVLKVELLNRFQGYAETSVSGVGTHIFIKGKLPEGFKGRDSQGIIEVFNSRCIVVTGDIIEGRANDIVEEQSEMEWLCETYLQKTNIQQLAVLPTSKSTKTDEEIINKVICSEKGKLLMVGNYDQVKQSDRMSKEEIQKYSSKSEADLAFCNLLLYLNGNDPEQATRIFLKSGMARDLEKKSSGYLQSQMNYATITLQSIYDWTKLVGIEEIEPEELDVEAKQRAFLERVAREGFTISDNEKINDYSTKYLLNYGFKPDRLVINTSIGDFDSAGNGKRFYYIMQSELIYNPSANEWAQWNGKKWCRCYDNELLGASQKVFDNLKHEAFQITMQSSYELDKDKKYKLEEQALELFRYASTNKNKRNCMEMIEFSKSHFNPIEHLKLEIPVNALNLSNGIYDFDTMKFEPHIREYYQTMISNVVYDPEATCELWHKTLKRILPDDEVRIYMQKVVGYTICSKFNEKAVFILFGDGNNGKTLFVNVLHRLVGEYSTTLSPNSIMENMSNSNNGPRPDLLKLRDKRFVSISEANESDKLSEGVIKSLSGGGYFSCRTLHKEPIEFRAISKFFFDTNFRLSVRGGSNASIWNRLKVIPFTVSIPKSEIDTELGDKLEAELSGVLNWAIKGYEMYMNEGLVEPESIKLVVDQYAEDMNACDQWMKECIEIKTDGQDIQKTSVNSKEMFQSYKNWCIHNGEFSWSQRKFTTELNKKDFAKFTKTVNGIVHYKMIKLNTLGELFYKKDTLYSNDFNVQYNECINKAFRQQAVQDSKLKELEDRPIRATSNIVSMPVGDLLGFGQ